MRGDGKPIRIGFGVGEQNRRVQDSKTKCFVLHRRGAVFSPGGGTPVQLKC